MASISTSKDEGNQVIVEGNRHVKTVTLTRPEKYNALSYQMVLLLLKYLKEIEDNPDVKIVIVKGKGRAFCAGGDIASTIPFMKADHWSLGGSFYRKILLLHQMMATYKKPQVFIINGLTMGSGAGLSMMGRLRVVTEKTAFAMPEVKVGSFPDVGASYFLSRLPGFYGEYIGLTGARLDGAEMLACGLATHFVYSKDLDKLEESLNQVDTDDLAIINKIINHYGHKASPKNGSSYRRIHIINKCFSKGSVEEIIFSLEQELLKGEDEWIRATINSMKMASPISLKLFLRSIREGQLQKYEDCLLREYRMVGHVHRKTVSEDFYEGVRAKLLEKDNNPKWKPPTLELVSNDMLNNYYGEISRDEGWEDLELPSRSSSIKSTRAKL